MDHTLTTAQLYRAFREFLEVASAPVSEDQQRISESVCTCIVAEGGMALFAPEDLDDAIEKEMWGTFYILIEDVASDDAMFLCVEDGSERGLEALHACLRAEQIYKWDAIEDLIELAEARQSPSFVRALRDWKKAAEASE